MVYGGTRLILKNTKTGEKIEEAVTDISAKLFWDWYYKLGGGKIDAAVTKAKNQIFRK